MHINKHDNIDYIAMDYMNMTHWKQHIQREDIVIWHVVPEMFGDGLWQGDVLALNRLLQPFLQAASPKQVIEVNGCLVSETSTTKQASSLQMMTMKQSMSVEHVLEIYVEYLKRVTLGFIHVVNHTDDYAIHIKGIKRPLIAMRKVAMKTIDGIQLEVLPDSLLARQSNTTSSFYFVIHEQTLWTYLTHFKPRLPWHLYRVSQAVIHEWVMHGFKHVLNR